MNDKGGEEKEEKGKKKRFKFAPPMEKNS